MPFAYCFYSQLLSLGNAARSLPQSMGNEYEWSCRQQNKELSTEKKKASSEETGELYNAVQSFTVQLLRIIYFEAKQGARRSPTISIKSHIIIFCSNKRIVHIGELKSVLVQIHKHFIKASQVKLFMINGPNLLQFCYRY